MSNVLDVLDQTMFDVGRASGSNTVLQCVWVYDRPVDADGLRRFRDHLARGRLSRRIERSPLPFGRCRWVAPDSSPAIEFVAQSRPREAFSDWLDEQVNVPIDCERGPEWHLATLPFTDGGAGVSLTVSHCLADGVGLWEAVAKAARGQHDPIEWPRAEARKRWQAMCADAGQTLSDIPAMSRAVGNAIRLSQRRRGGPKSPRPRTAKAPVEPTHTDESMTFPAATVFVDAGAWDARARALGGTPNTLLVGLSARLAERAGRVAADGSVVVTVPVDERSPDDTRANAIGGVSVTVDPTHATADLTEIRSAVKQALVRHGDVPDLAQTLNAVVPLLSKRQLNAAVAATRGTVPNLVGSSNVGLVDAAASRADGTDANAFAIRIHHLGTKGQAMVLRYSGVQSLLAGTANGQVFVSLVASVPGQSNTNDDVRQDLSNALRDFSLTGTYL